MYKTDLSNGSLPDIEMYAGDATPWNVELVDENGNRYTASDLNGQPCSLQITPFKLTTGMGYNAPAVEPLINLSGTLTSDSSGAYVVFNMDSSLTVNMRGKFIYQVSVGTGEAKRICQGSLYIKQNVNRW